MSEPTWQPSKEEVARILDEMRPIITELVRREEESLSADLRARAGV